MLNLIIMLFMTIAASGAAMYAGYTFFQTSQNVTDRQMTYARLEETASALSANILEAGGNFLVPAGINGADYMQVPSWITPNARTVGNVPFLYCPYAAADGVGTAATVNLPGAGSYAIRVFSSALTHNHNYVTASAAPSPAAPDGTLAVLVAPALNDAAPPDCANLVLDASGHLILNGSAGSVIAITAGQFFKSRVYAAAEALDLYVSDSGAGDYSGTSAANAMTLDNAMALWRAVKPKRMIAHLATGTYAADATTFPVPAQSNVSAGNDHDQILILKGGDAATTIIDLTADLAGFRASAIFEKVTLNMAGQDWTIEGVDQITLSDAIVNVDNLTLYDGALFFAGAGVTLNASNDIYVASGGAIHGNAPVAIVFSANKGVYVKGAFGLDNNLAITAPNGTTPLYVLSGGVVDVQPSGTITLAASGGALASAIEIANGGMLRSGGAITISQAPSFYGIGVGGQAVLSSQLLFPNGAPVGIQLMNGGELTLANFTLGSSGTSTARPDIGIYDAGGSRVTGKGAGVAIYANPAAVAPRCWNGVTMPHLFSRSEEGDGKNSSATLALAGYDFLQLDNGSEWECHR